MTFIPPFNVLDVGLNPSHRPSESGADALQAEILAGHRTGIKDAYLKRKPEMVANACKAVQEYYFPRRKQQK